MVTKVSLIEGQEQTILTPIIKKITSEIEKKFIRDPDTYNYLMTKYEKENVEVPDFLYDNTLGGPTLDIEYEIKPTEDINLRTSRMHPLAKPILWDRDVKFVVTPFYQMQELTIHFRFRAQSKQELLNIKNRFYSYYINTDYRLYLDLPYEFLLPYNVIVLCNEIKTLKGFEGDVFDYINSISTKRLDIAFKRSSNWKVPVFRGIQGKRITNIITPPEEMEIEHNDVPEYKLSFDIVTTFNQPIGLFLDIPYLVNNKPVNPVWLGREPVAKLVDKEDNGLNISQAVTELYLGIGGKTLNDILFKIPSNDEFSVANDPNKFLYNIKWLSILIEVDENDPTLLFNLEDLKYIGVPEDIVEYMKDYKDGLNHLGGCGIRLELYEFNYVKDKGLYVDDDYNVKLKEPMDIDKIYHAVFRFITDLHLLVDLDEEGLKRTKKLFDKYGILTFESDGEIIRHKYGKNQD